MSAMEAGKLLDEAMQSHKEGNIEDALSKYKKSIENDCADKRAYANLAAILRSKGEAKEAAKVANKGLRICGQNSPILLNTLGNSLRDLGRMEEAISVYRRAIKHAPRYMDPKYSLVNALNDAGYKALSTICLKAMVRNYGMQDETLINMLITKEVEEACNSNREISKNVSKILEHLDVQKLNNKLLPQHWFHMSQLCLSRDKNKEAIEYHHKGLNALMKAYNGNEEKNKGENNKFTNMCKLNFACGLLRNGEFEADGNYMSMV